MGIKIGILGVGGFGLYCMEQYRQLPGVQIAAIGGTNPEKYARLADTYNIPFHTTNWRELVTHPEVDIVYLATPPYIRKDPAITAMQAGKHVFCEKPLAMTLEDADAMLTTAEHHDVRLGINFVMRYAGLYDIVRTIVSKELLGAPLHFGFENLAGDLPVGHWFWDPQRSGGIPIEHGVHFFDIFSSILGEGRLSWADRTARMSGEEDKWLMVLRYQSRVLGTFYHAFDKPSPLERTRTTLDFEHGIITLDEWIPARMRLDAMVNAEAAKRIAELIPTAVVTALPKSETYCLANGSELAMAFRVTVDFSPGSKEEIYAGAVRDAMTDFIAWTQNPLYHPRVTGIDGRAALHTAIQATTMARLSNRGNA